MKNFLLSIFLFCSGLTVSGQASSDSATKFRVNLSKNSTRAKNDSLERATNMVRADSVANDTISCTQLVLAKYYEKENDDEKALAAYQEAVKCAVAKDKREAISGVERTSKQLEGIRHKSWEKFAEWVNTTFGVAIPLVIALLSLPCAKLLIRLFKWLRRDYKKGRFGIDIQPLISMVPDKAEFVTKLLNKLINSNLDRLKAYQRAKQKVEMQLAQNAKPTIRSEDFGEVWRIVGEIALPSLTPLFPKIYKYICPSDFAISGYIFQKRDKWLRLKIELSGKDILRNWEITLDNSFSNIDAMCLEIVLYLNSKVEQT
jgi:hypothetical protein